MTNLAVEANCSQRNAHADTQKKDTNARNTDGCGGNEALKK
jgi:hypothetical protein